MTRFLFNEATGPRATQRRHTLSCLGLLALAVACSSVQAGLVFETTSPYHHIRVIDQQGLRTLCFDDALESRVAMDDPTKGHFEYTEYFQMAWLWNAKINRVLLIGLGGGSAQRALALYHPAAKLETVEIDPAVERVARDFFTFVETDLQKVHIEDGRVFLRRSPDRYDLIILDAYVQGRYGSAIPQHLVTKEFFELVRDHLTTNGVVAYNVIGTPRDWRADIVGSIFRTMKTVFPNVYTFRAKTSWNMVLIATRLGPKADLATLQSRAAFLVKQGIATMPGFQERVNSLEFQDPASAYRSPILTDDYAPVEGLSAPSGLQDPHARQPTNAPANRPTGR